ncbi:transglycosylase family protein [Kitasatospora sp. NPDC001664]
MAKHRTSALMLAAATLAGLATAGTAGSAQAASVAMWDKMAQCESTGNWAANTGNTYFGGLQFSQSTWVAQGGTAYAARADLATKEQQIRIAEKLLRAAGPGQWPVCSQQVGLTNDGVDPYPTNPPVTSPVNVQVGIVGGDGALYSQYGNYAAGRFNPSWTGVGGVSLSKVTSVTVGDVTHFYAVAGGRVYGRDLNPGNSWTAWAEIPGGATGVRDITASTSGANVILGIAGGDGSFFTQFGNYDLGRFDADWVRRSGSGLTNVTSVTSKNGGTVRFYGVAGGRVFGSDFTLSSNSAAEWSEIPGGATDVRDIAATADGNNVVLAVAGYGGSFHTQYGNFDQGHFDAAWTQRAGSAIDSVAATTTPDGRTVHFYGIAQGRAYGADFTLGANAVSNWSEITGGATSAKDITASQSK